MRQHSSIATASRLSARGPLLVSRPIAELEDSPGHPPRRYAPESAAVSGVFDWAQLISDKKYDYTQFGSPEYNFLMRRLGDPRRDVEKFDEIAPVRHVDRVRVPVFVSHGRDDDNVDVGQSTRLVSELEKHNVPHESYIVGSEGHGMHYFKDRVEQYTKIEAFLAKYMAPDSPPVP